MSGHVEATGSERRRAVKSAAAFRTISEVAEDLDVPPHVLRFWESKFSQIRPLKRGGGRRYYRPEDIDLLRLIRERLYTDGYTIKGVQRLLREGGVKGLSQGMMARPPAEPVDPPLSREVEKSGEAAALRAALKDVLGDLEALGERLRKAIG